MPQQEAMRRQQHRDRQRMSFDPAPRPMSADLGTARRISATGNAF
jgi:hypothetical protein